MACVSKAVRYSRSRDQILLDAARPVLAYIARAGIGDDKEGLLFRPMKPDGTPDRLGGRGIGIHSLRKTAINDAIRNGASLHSAFPCLHRLSGV